jgi:AcrR family transcriptional regulator
MATRTIDGRRARQREQRREELLDAADRAVRRAGTDVSMDEVAAEAGITKPVLYRHFGDKEGLYDALAERYVEELEQTLQGATSTTHGRRRLEATIDAYLRYVERQPERYRFLLEAAGKPRTGKLVADFRRRNVESCAFATAESLRRAGLDPELSDLWAHSVSGMIRSVGIWWLETRSLPREQLAEHLTAVLWEGLPALKTP